MSTQTEYKGVKYTQLPDGTWQLTWPSGLKGNTKAKDEDTLKAAIDLLIQE